MRCAPSSTPGNIRSRASPRFARRDGSGVLDRLALGDSNKDIAAQLGCTESTVEVHVSALLKKAGVDSRSKLIARYWRA
jgi:DNA-binding NarL/FixJ family response regulator